MQWPGSSTAVMVAEEVTNLILYPYYTPQLAHHDQYCFTSLCVNCSLILWHVLPHANPAVPLRGLFQHSCYLSWSLICAIMQAHFPGSVYWKHRSVPGSLSHTSSDPPTPWQAARLWRSGCRTLLLPLREQGVKSATCKPINPDRFVVAPCEVQRVHCAYS